MTDALDRLVKAVEAGELPLSLDILLPIMDHYTSVSAAFHGSVDAAKDLHDSLLHESDWVNLNYSNRYEEESRAEITTKGGTWQAKSENPARAWLLAILRAYQDTSTHD